MKWIGEICYKQRYGWRTEVYKLKGKFATSTSVWDRIFCSLSLSLQFPYRYNVIVWILLHQSATIAMSMKWHTYSILSPHLPSTRSQTYTSAEQSSTTLVFFIGHANTFNASQTSAIQNCTESFTMVIYEIFLQHSSTRTIKYTARIVELNYLL